MHVFLRVDEVAPLLSQSYTDPHKVLSRTEKHFIIDKDRRKSYVSLDRAKPTYIFKDLLDSIDEFISSKDPTLYVFPMNLMFHLPNQADV